MTKRNKRKKKYVDPQAEREAEKYTHPVPSREYIVAYLQEQSPMTYDELIHAFGLQLEEEHEGLRRRLRAMERDGQLFYTRRGYGIPEKMDLVVGVVIGHKDGYGFVTPDDGSDDLFLSARQMRTVFDGDRVLARVTNIDRRGRREGMLVEVLERNTHQVVGRFIFEDNIGFVIPDNKRITHDIIIPAEYQSLARHGQIVIADIVEYPSLRSQPIGRVVEILGDHMAPGMEIDIAIRTHALPNVWPQALLKETAIIDENITKPMLQRRTDIRELPLVTIDGEDAQDFDDAVFCKKRKLGGWTLYVAIADVSHYVQHDSHLDQEALLRGNSVYFPGRVIPMLPEKLSNNLCSLKPQIDRLCIVCEMTISASGKLSRYKFYEAVMYSHARLTYNQVAEMLKGEDVTLQKRHAALLPHLHELYRLYQILRTNREARGAIDFETTETRVIFGENRKIEQIVPVQRTEAHKVIEECMLMANVAAARFLIKNKMPALFRVHACPSPEKILDLRRFLSELGLSLGGGKQPSPAEYSQILRSIGDRPDAHLIQTVLLRSLSQAVYSPENIGHFGLAFEAYTHFTSPIRRYPDLLVHRAIRHVLHGGKVAKFAYDNAVLAKLGEHSSMTERRADEATRDAMDWLKCEFMRDRVGEEFAGIVSSVTGFGLFIELQNIYVEGLLHITALPKDYYHFDPLRHRLQGERSGRIYHLGDRIQVRIVRVDLDNKKIDFELIETITSTKKRTRPKRA